MNDSDVRKGDPSRPNARSTGYVRKSLALALGISIAILVTEGAFRAWRSIRGNPYDGERAEQQLDEWIAQLKGLNFLPKEFADEPLGNRMSLHPYEGFQAQSAWKRRDNPGDYFTSQEGLENYDILLMGGSVAAGFGNWTATVLVPLLEADPRLAGRRVVVHNRACPAHKQPQLATNLEWAFSLGIRPDAVVLLDGFNELAVAANNAEYGVHPNFPAWMQMQTALSGPLSDPAEFEIAGSLFVVRAEAEQLAKRARRWGMLRSAVLGNLVESEFAQLANRSRSLLAELVMLTARRDEQRPLLIRGPFFVNDPASVLRMSVRAWMEGSRSMQAACRARNIHFIHVLQPAARDKGSKPLTEKEAQISLEPAPWRESIERGYPRLREAGAQLAGEGINFHDGSRVFADHPEEIYLDPCHFEGEGCRILGPFIAQAILDSWPE